MNSDTPVTAVNIMEAEIFQALPIGVLQLDAQLCVSWASEQFLKLFSCGREDVQGQRFENLISQKDRKGQIRFYSQLAQFGDKNIDTHVSLRIGAQDYLVHLRMTRCGDSRTIVYVEDLLGSRNLTFQLLWDEEKFSNIVLSSGEGIVILDKHDRIIEFNRKFFEFMQFKSAHGVMISEPALIEKNLFDLLGNSFVNFRSAIHQKLSRLRKHQEVIWYNNRCFEVLANPTVMPIKGFTGNCIVFKDITAQKISEELTKKLNAQSHELELKNEALGRTLDELEENNNRLNLLNQEKNYLMGVVAHDLRAPLNQIIGLTNIIVTERDHLTQLQKECSDKILESAFRLRNLINKVLDQEAIENESLNVDLKPVYVQEVMRQVMDSYRDEASGKHIRMIEELPDNTIMAMLDANYFRMAFENLLSNAIKFSVFHGEVRIRLFAEGERCVVEIKDSGPGFTEEELPRLFRKFQKFSARPTGNEESRGLGLSIVKRYVDIMKGTISCVNDRQGGARFQMSFHGFPDDMTW